MNTQKINFPFLISGKIGNVVGRVVNGKQIFAKMPSPRKGKPSLRELEIRRNMAIAIKFIKPIVPLLRKYNEPHKKGFNKAISHILRNAIHGSHPDQCIDCSQVILGEGVLPNPKNYSVMSPAKGLLEFNWSLDRGRRWFSRSDRFFAVAYCEALHDFKYELDGSERHERQFLMDAAFFSGRQVHVWFGFASSNSMLISTSIYAGSVSVL